MTDLLPASGLSRPAFPRIFAGTRSVGGIFLRLTGFRWIALNSTWPEISREKNSLSADALSGAMADGRRLPDRRLRALFALSRDRVLDRGAGLRCRVADHALPGPRVGDRALQEFGIRRHRP